MQIPPVGTRVLIRHRLPAGSAPPLTDVIGHLVHTQPTLAVRTKRGDVVAVSVDDVVVIKALTDAPVRTSDIRNLEHAAALAWPGVEQEWVDGWFCRFGHGSTRRANSALPLAFSASTDLTAVRDWYAARSLPPLLSLPDRLYRVPTLASTDAENLVMTYDLAPSRVGNEVSTEPRPDDEWLHVYDREVPVDVLKAVVGGPVTFASIPGAAVARAAITGAPDGTRWLGLSALKVADQHRRHGYARTVCHALLGWGADRGAHRAYTQVLDDNVSAIALFESMGFTLHHRSRYAALDAESDQKGGGL